MSNEEEHFQWLLKQHSALWVKLMGLAVLRGPRNGYDDPRNREYDITLREDLRKVENLICAEERVRFPATAAYEPPLGWREKWTGKAKKGARA